MGGEPPSVAFGDISPAMWGRAHGVGRPEKRQSYGLDGRGPPYDRIRSESGSNPADRGSDGG